MESHPPLQLMNTMGRRLETFEPRDPSLVRVYTCGPTVYSYAHIGNFRSFLLADTLRRVLEFNGYRVHHVRNITDVGHLTNDTLGTGLDKIEEAARRQNMSAEDIARVYTEAFWRDARRLNLLEPHDQPRATEYIAPMQTLAARLIDSGYAYESMGNVYFDVARFPAYGALSGNNVTELVEGARVEVGEGKRAAADFALWKAAGPEKLMRWDSPWGCGVPGWHIECSAMSMALLGEQLDVHTGGIDNMFPHHEDEIAQSEAASGKEFVRYWLHSAFLEFPGGGKMAKSLGNIYTITDLIERGIHPLAYRYFTFQAHYRTPLSFSWEALEAAQTGLNRVYEAAAEILQESGVEQSVEDCGYLHRFHERVNDDLDMPGALAVLHDTLGASMAGGQKLSLLYAMDRVLGLDIARMAGAMSRVEPAERDLLTQRAQARAARDWVASDQLRERLAVEGLDVKDTPSGQHWVRRDVLARETRNFQDGAAE